MAGGRDHPREGGYHPRLGPIQTCDTCMVDVNGKLTRACSTAVHAGMKVVTDSAPVREAQMEAMDVILGNHLLYCTVQVPGAKPPSLFALGRRMASQDARRGLAAAVSVMEVLGRGLAKESASRE